MKFQEKMLRKINSRIQYGDSSAEHKLFWENAILSVDIVKKLRELVSDDTKNYDQLKTLNDKLIRIGGILWEE